VNYGDLSQFAQARQSRISIYFIRPTMKSLHFRAWLDPAVLNLPWRFM
jgi:hypothetical protein